MLLGCSGDDGSTENVKQTSTGGHGGAKAPLYGLTAGTTSAAGATSYAGRAGAGGVAAGGAGAGGAAAAAGILGGAPEAGRDSFGFGGISGFGGAWTVLRPDHESAGSGGTGAARDTRPNGEGGDTWLGLGGFAGSGFWFSN
jgi:hypothetical protein